MARYRKIDPRIWNDEKFRTMSDDGKLVFLFLLTHPHMTSLGAMRGTFPGLAAELRWSSRRFISAAQESISQHIVDSNEAATWIGIPNFIRYNEPEGPNSVSKAWAVALDMLPECPEKRVLIERCRAYLAAQSDSFKHAMGHAIWDAFGDAKSKPCHIQEQEQKQEQEQESPYPQGGDSGSTRTLGTRRHPTTLELDPRGEALPGDRQDHPRASSGTHHRPLQPGVVGQTLPAGSGLPVPVWTHKRTAGFISRLAELDPCPEESRQAIGRRL